MCIVSSAGGAAAAAATGAGAATTGGVAAAEAAGASGAKVGFWPFPGLYNAFWYFWASEMQLVCPLYSVPLNVVEQSKHVNCAPGHLYVCASSFFLTRTSQQDSQLKLTIAASAGGGCEDGLVSAATAG
ncbi:hypothetical protein DFH27DRAFT_554799 [Peziza echinospora]|nr:hypothetical protein DFH27DRAFT_554799 [Peziza echinospora]